MFKRQNHQSYKRVAWQDEGSSANPIDKNKQPHVPDSAEILWFNLEPFIKQDFKYLHAQFSKSGLDQTQIAILKRLANLPLTEFKTNHDFVSQQCSYILNGDNRKKCSPAFSSHWPLLDAFSKLFKFMPEQRELQLSIHQLLARYVYLSHQIPNYSTERLPIYRKRNSMGHPAIDMESFVHYACYIISGSWGSNEMQPDYAGSRSYDLLADFPVDPRQHQSDTLAIGSTALVNTEKEAAWQHMLNFLTPRECNVLAQRYIYQLTLVQIGRKLHLSTHKAREIEAGALTKLRRGAAYMASYANSLPYDADYLILKSGKWQIEMSEPTL